MIIYIVQEKDLCNFGYVEEGEDIPKGFRLWASLDTEGWSLTFPDGRTIMYGSFPELHQDLGEIMLTRPAGPREAVHTRRHRQQVELVDDLAEQWGEIGARVLEKIREREAERLDVRELQVGATPAPEPPAPRAYQRVRIGANLSQAHWGRSPPLKSKPNHTHGGINRGWGREHYDPKELSTTLASSSASRSK